MKILFSLQQWFSRGSEEFYFPRVIWQCLETFLVIGSWWCYWHLIGRGQGCCSTCNVQDSSPQKNYLAQDFSNPAAEKPWFRMICLNPSSVSYFGTLAKLLNLSDPVYSTFKWTKNRVLNLIVLFWGLN